MSSRLASFRGPSTPTPSPVQVKSQFKSPSSPARSTESTYHRKVRTYLQELRTACRTWDDLVLVDGLKAIRSLIDARTELDNTLSALPDGKQPHSRIVGPKLSFMEDRIAEMDLVILKLRKQFQKMNSLVDGLEAVLTEAHKTKGWNWVQDEPLWTTWSLEKFVTSVSEILRPYHRSLDLHIELVLILRTHSVSFEVSSDALNRWIEQPWLEEHSWDAEWEDLCLAEIHLWDSR
ncbi:hypothetical protein EW146_g7856 [Bondarzewia mesenterica]|uniref:Uncharacterized protein n=1 Tax=Bondarzewia mesenterica TaxID=1095465 RepID=A0A4S4LIV8_9AGAM|nr:hypothetical protein EW146_g7856 [Bondarzewia mesenterica]